MPGYSSKSICIGISVPTVEEVLVVSGGGGKILLQQEQRFKLGRFLTIDQKTLLSTRTDIYEI